jgi:hypothetical protein
MKTFSRVHNNIFVLNEINESNSRVGKCYELAGRYVSGHPDSVLIHGKLINPFSKGMSEVEHAWVEEGDEIFDPVMDKRFPKNHYEKLFNVTVYHKYTYEQVLNMTLRHEHWGPWD